MAKQPGFYFYPGDWQKDAGLRRSSHAAKGIWMDMLCLMFECDERGVLASGGDPWTLDEIACAVGGAQSVTLAGIQELLAKGVASRNDAGAIFSRRLVRDEQIRRERVKAGRLGGSKIKANHQANMEQTTEEEKEVENAFESFWKEVPTKIGKGTAREAYRKARQKASHAVIVAGLASYRANEQARQKSSRGDCRPLHPTTWLNGERWTDEMPAKSGRRRDGIAALSHAELQALFAFASEREPSIVGYSPGMDHVKPVLARYLDAWRKEDA